MSTTKRQQLYHVHSETVRLLDQIRGTVESAPMDDCVRLGCEMLAQAETEPENVFKIALGVYMLMCKFPPRLTQKPTPGSLTLTFESRCLRGWEVRFVPLRAWLVTAGDDKHHNEAYDVVRSPRARADLIEMIVSRWWKYQRPTAAVSDSPRRRARCLDRRRLHAASTSASARPIQPSPLRLCTPHTSDEAAADDGILAYIHDHMLDDTPSSADSDDDIPGVPDNTMPDNSKPAHTSAPPSSLTEQNMTSAPPEQQQQPFQPPPGRISLKTLNPSPLLDTHREPTHRKGAVSSMSKQVVNDQADGYSVPSVQPRYTGAFDLLSGLNPTHEFEDDEQWYQSYTTAHTAPPQGSSASPERDSHAVAGSSGPAAESGEQELGTETSTIAIDYSEDGFGDVSHDPEAADGYSITDEDGFPAISRWIADAARRRSQQ